MRLKYCIEVVLVKLRHLVSTSLETLSIATSPSQHDIPRKYEYKRAQCEDPEVIREWFRLVHNIINKYDIQNDDIYNFNETGFAMGIADTSRVATTSDRRGRPPWLQAGDREWATSIECINSDGWCLSPMVILKDKNHQAAWYQANNLPHDWVLALSENGCTNNELGFEWLQNIFELQAPSKSVGAYRFLILDGHGSHATPQLTHFAKNDQSSNSACIRTHHTSYNHLMWAVFRS